MKKLLSVFMVLFCGIIIVGCGTQKLSSNYSEEKLKAAAEETIKNLNNNKYDEIVNGSRASLKAQLPKDKIKEAWEPLQEHIGKYKEISRISFQEKDGIAIVVAIAQYEEGKVQFTLSYDEDMKLAAIYMK
ncbi:hypothetical protein BH721_02255 [Clostridium baratii]|uniref:DUF3887 domain-containing protein n=1 Tax=Clostridium baratii TaxID=1561 RepID=UPI0009A2BD21|nr:DUF3887 domain-containing protein [Clostridium baratii]OPF51375.1 hypothetical protein A1M12_02220 [Clostridium baratii]OPF55551.1 hypothetical protein BH721_02255 [Clostridium baratii]OPF57070.1 hypothetical protein BH724_11175 [Clostridium baratii]OPF60068.1 hypothetical protein BH725_05670 [Clostridium baratii]